MDSAEVEEEVGSFNAGSGQQAAPRRGSHQTQFATLQTAAITHDVAEILAPAIEQLIKNQFATLKASIQTQSMDQKRPSF